MRLAGRTAVVTGAASGLGRATAVRLAAEGAHVVVSDRHDGPPAGPGDLPGNATTLELIEAAGGSASFVRADVTHRADVERLIEAGVAPSGRLDVVVSNAGIFGGSSILDTTDDDWDRSLDVNLRSQFLVCREAIGRMITQDPLDEVRGRIVTIASQLGLTAPPGRLDYAVAKAGVAQLTRQLAVDYARHGIIVNAIAPGRIITGGHPGEREYLEHGTVDAATEYSLARTPFPRLGRPEDVAGAALFLASDDCSFVSGHTLMVDGGWMAY
jgi:NAD(P)-dependent dehydrogenase (short-subunit alcohol dehydrogenase family)